MSITKKVLIRQQHSASQSNDLRLIERSIHGTRGVLCLSTNRSPGCMYGRGNTVEEKELKKERELGSGFASTLTPGRPPPWDLLYYKLSEEVSIHRLS